MWSFVVYLGYYYLHSKETAPQNLGWSSLFPICNFPIKNPQTLCSQVCGSQYILTASQY